MINQVDIASFGSFSDLTWKKALKDKGNTVQNFARLNILYGRNYSGKTTLSRVFRSLETRKIPLNYIGAAFTLYGDKGNVSQADLATHGYDIRVYNRDFVADNLSFLINQVNGEIKTFAIVGETNQVIETELKSIEVELGSVEAKTGLRFDLDSKRKDRDRTKNNHKTATDSLEDKLKDHANNKIKKNRDYGNSIYNIEKIKADIASTKSEKFTPLSVEQQAAKLALLKQEALPDISGTLSINLKLKTIEESAKNILSKTVTPTQALQELLNDAVLQTWVKQGIPLHKEKRSTCAFCRQDLPHNIWHVLDSHFSKESADLEEFIDACLASITTAVDEIPNFVKFTNTQFYSEEKALFETTKIELDKQLDIYKKDLVALQNALKTRKDNLFQTLTLPTSIHSPEKIGEHVKAINDLVTKNNGRTKDLEKEKDAARTSLRLTDVASFIEAIKYGDEKTKIEKLKKEAEIANTTFQDAEKIITEKEARVTFLLSQQKDERKGAEKVNSLLSHFFGHDGIRLEAKDNADKTAVKFEITRDGKSAYNLSEGECSLIAFCYFIAKLEDPESKDKELIIYIDDPISSLDGNHIFFIFSLIESRLAKPYKKDDGSNAYRYKQLFISTHNLDFLKYLKRLSIPKKKLQPADGGKAKSVDDSEHFMVERNGASSNLILMPSYLREYITEFNYLFHQIYKCKNQEMANQSHEPFYGFGNNLRKFLEAFLFFKYPYHDDWNDGMERIKKFFGHEEPLAVALINRLNNEFSHLESIPDRGFKPVEIPEISKVANFVLDKIFEADPTQFNALLKSIGEPERV